MFIVDNIGERSIHALCVCPVKVPANIVLVFLAVPDAKVGPAGVPFPIAAHIRAPLLGQFLVDLFGRQLGWAGSSDVAAVLVSAWFTCRKVRSRYSDDHAAR